MSKAADDSVEDLEEQLERAERTLSSLRPLDADQARRVAERTDRLHSQLLTVSEPPTIDAAHERLATHPAGSDDFDVLAGEMGPPDGEG
jgi:hypothetical protein